SELEQALQLANDYDDEVIAERWIDGSEYTVAILDDTALPIIQLKTPHAFYDYAAKYEANTTQYCQQTDLSSEEKTVCQQLALSAFKALHMSGWGRIDIMRCQKGQFYLLEANSVPGMTAHSLVPMAAKSAGITMSSLVQQILSLANTRRQ
ncbi:MAG TPA: D-alanine--D-alanine ligase, partial [Gammaproteobacteria bacterium]|nr:D-alanine--D-alanine ligase [Gammaproteobacteria bacterium]